MKPIRSALQDPFPVSRAAELELDRRRLLVAAACAVPLALAGEWLGRLVEAAAPPPLEMNAAEAAVLRVGEARAVAAADGREALLVRLSGDEVVAFDRRCPHLGCPVIWSAERGRFECPCHRAAFEAASGRVLFGPAQRGLTPVTIRAARVE